MGRFHTAVLVASPFQTMCALEAISEFECNEVRFFTVDDPQNTEKIQSLLADFGYRATVIKKCSNTLMWIRNNYRVGKFDTIIVGDYFSYIFLILSALFSRPGARIIYVDDGSSTLTLNCDVFGHPHTRQGKWKLMRSVLRIKRAVPLFYSIYDIGKCGSAKTVRHFFKSLVGRIGNGNNPEGVYIIGTNTSQLKLEKREFENILDCIHRFYDGNDSIHYCPHRRDNNRYDDFCSKTGIDFFDTRISVEYDFVKNDIYPKVVIGFGSTALYTLKKMFPLAEVYNIEFKTGDINLARVYKYISGIYGKENIINCTVDYWNRK